ncbi:SLC13 family permease [Streptomyces sp. NPDC058471]|uniref:SLC13 family permease n=1 Tax=Streptomyces sp. NPDC058471 TaxID=3346516 RepID=UPI003655F60C
MAPRATDDLFSGFPGDLFVVLVGVTLLFAIAKNNGTVDWLVNAAVKAVRGRIALIPWGMVLVTAVLTAVGAVTPAAVGIVAPIGLGFAAAYGISPVLMGLLIANGASAGGFSPIGVFGSITNNVVERNHLPGNPALLFTASFLFNVALCVIVFFAFGGRQLLGQRAEAYKGGGEGNAGSERHDDAAPPGGQLVKAGEAGTAPRRALAVTATAAPTKPDEPLRLDGPRALTLIGLLSLVAGALFFDLDVGLMALTNTVALSLVSPKSVTGAVDRCAWSTVLLVCGLITALAISASVVDASPFSTSGALVTANTPAEQRDFVFRRLMAWGLGISVVGPLVTWGLFVVPSSL